MTRESQLEGLNLFSTRRSTTDALENLYSSPSPEVKLRLKRVLDILDGTWDGIENSDVQTTSITTFANLGGVLAELNSFLLNPNKSFNMAEMEKDLDRIDELADKLLDFVPYLGYRGSTEASVLLGAEKDAESILSKLHKDVDEGMEDVRTSWTETQSEFERLRKAAQTELEAVQAIKVQGQELAALHSGRVLNNDFQNRAGCEVKAAKRWTAATWIFAVVSALMLVGLIVGHFVAPALFKSGDGTTPDYQLLGSQALLTATLGLIAKWCSKRASRHLNEEAKYHRLAVSFGVLDSFIAPLAPADAAQIRIEMAKNILANPSITENSAEFENSPVADLVKSLLDKH